MNALRALMTGRWLVSLTIMATLWGVTAGGRVDGSGGVLAILAIGFTALLWFALFDQGMYQRTGEARLTLARGRNAINAFLITPTITLFAIPAVALSLLTLLASFWIGAGLLAVLLGMFAISLGRKPKSEPKSTIGIEFELPLAAIMLPTTLFSLNGGVGSDLPTGAALAAISTTLALGVWLLLCSVRDEVADTAALNKTTATFLSRTGASWLVIVSIAIMMIITAAGAEAGIWHWTVPAIVGIGGMLVIWSLATQSEENVIPAWAGISVFIALASAAELPSNYINKDDPAPHAQVNTDNTDEEDSPGAVTAVKDPE